jgi:N,N'-diacetyllegionaminate synthase
MKHTYIIAEAGVNHNGKLDLALKLCDAAKKSGVDAIKFQTWKTENIVTMTTNLASYQESNISNGEISQFEMLKKLELSYHDFVTIKNYCEKIGIIFLSTPDDSESLVFLMKLGIDFIKVGSGEVNNTPFLREIGSTKMPVVLSTGMSNLGEVERAYNILIEAGTPKISLLHCTTNYPCPMDEVNLTAMVTLRDAFKCKVGYSDHTEGIEISIAAVALGAEIIEKHFTLDKSMEGPDHKASLDPMELAEMVKAIRNIEKAMGNGVKKANKSEKEIEKVIKKKIVASKNISKGEIFSNLNITVKRSDIGLSAEFWDLVQGRESNLNYEIDQPIVL